MSSPVVALRRSTPERPWNAISSEITIGKDILELLSSSMYVDPMSIYREYVQNAADAIDEARVAGVIAHNTAGRIEFYIDYDQRNVRIRDNGISVPTSEFVERLTAFGASLKRGQSARGFRGVGRLAGVGYCQELLFRCRAKGESTVSELRWDCRKLKQLLRVDDRQKHLRDVVSEAVTARKIPAHGFPDRFFEVELQGIIRHKNDQLLDPVAIDAYLSQVAPVPFAPEFRFGPTITEELRALVNFGDVEIMLPGMEGPVYRPHRDSLELGERQWDPFTDIQFFRISGMDGGTAAIGWVLHHGYTGALPHRTLQKGLRLRVGNIQVGDDRILEDLFVEPRFNSWSIGEFHIVDRRVVPNGRRDHFEQNVHYTNILNHLVPVARELTRRCRSSSIQRNRVREFQRQVETAKEGLAILRQGVLGKAEQDRLLREVNAAIAEAERILKSDLFPLPEDSSSMNELQKLRRAISKITGDRSESPLTRLPRNHRKAYENVFSLIYECAPNRSVAKAIVDKIMNRL